jgi:hypothetical protein
MTISRLALAAVLLSPAVSSGIHAQIVPAFAVGIVYGNGPTSGSAGDTWFLNTSTTMSNVDLAVRLGSAGQTRPVVVLGYSLPIRSTNVVASCAPAPNGSCRGTFPATDGLSLGLGLRQTVGARGLLGLTAGVASLQYHAEYVEVDGSWRLLGPLSAVGEYRYVKMPDVGSHVWFRPLMFGARVSW